MLDLDKMREAGIDYKQGLGRFGGKAELYEKFLNRFAEDPNYADLCRYMAEENYDEAFKSVHAMKGVTGNLSLNELYQAVYNLTEALRAKNIDEAKQLFGTVQESYNKTLAALQA